MIHPINIPEDLMASNPKRAEFVEKRRRPALTYTSDGRRMIDGKPTTPNEPTKLWNDFFLRSITRCMVLDSESPQQEHGTLLNVVDLSPSSSCPMSDDEHRNSTPPFQRMASFNASCIAPPSNTHDFGEHKIVERTESVHTAELTDAAEIEFREMQADMRRQGKQAISKQDSLIVDLKSVSSNLEPCCSGSRLEHEKLKEFVRFDFEHINLFGGTQSSRRKSVTLIPESIGRRIWVNKTCLDRCTAVELSPHAVLRWPKITEKPELRFHVSSVSTSNDQLFIDIYVYNTFPHHLRIQAYLHAHSVNGRAIGPKIVSIAHEFTIEPTKDNNVRVTMNLNDEIRISCETDNSYLIVTLMGRILH
uniref:Major sperm protein n=1 Tax=Steinernema glaseri TaxID=37863 RepID=A0A1I8AKM3_9BILA